VSTTNKLTGKAQAFVFTGTTLPVKKVTNTVKRKLADATDSTDYDSGTDMVWESQLPVTLSQEMKIEGNYNTSTVPTAVIATLYSGATAVAASWLLKSGVTVGHGLYDLSDFETSAPVDDIVAYSMTVKLNGVFTAGS
jgi:hypothetical protein